MANLSFALLLASPARPNLNADSVQVEDSVEKKVLGSLIANMAFIDKLQLPADESMMKEVKTLIQECKQ